MARVFMDSRSAALAAKHRQRGPSVLERLRADEEAAAQAAAVASERWAKRRKTAPVVQPPPECTGGMAMKTGMVAARAMLAASSSGIVAAQDRQAALVGTGKYRVAEKVAREAPMGSLATNEMPKRKNSTASPAEFKTNFRKWMKTSLGSKVRGLATGKTPSSLIELPPCACAGQAGAHGFELRVQGAAHERLDGGAEVRAILPRGRGLGQALLRRVAR